MEPSTFSFLFLTLESKRNKIYSIIFRNDLNHVFTTSCAVFNL